MSFEDQHTERKSLRLVTGRSADWADLARTCVCFANGAGGRVLIGTEDGETAPPAQQTVPVDLLDQLRKRIGELTVNVQALPSLQRDANGGEFVELLVERSPNVASTADGRYFLRVADACVPVVGDDVLRLANERPGRPWEAMDSGVARAAVDAGKLGRFVEAIRASDRVKDSVKEKRLGVLLLGTTADRWALGTAPLVQAIKVDALGQKINKWVWDDAALSPVELVDAVWRELPDFRESYEVAEGLYRRQVPAYDEKVVRELLVNALVHRPYTQRGDIFLNLHPERLEVVNPGRLPLGVTPANILHASRRRNEGLARVFHDLGLMEREGSGFDLMYDRLLSQGRPAPLPEEELTQRERITLGVLAQSEGMTARELAASLETGGAHALENWLGRLADLGLVSSAGRTKGTRYFVNPAVLAESGVKLATSLMRIEPHRLLELVREDLRRYPGAKIGEIGGRIGPEINRSQLRRALKQLVGAGEVVMQGQRATARYRLRGAP